MRKNILKIFAVLLAIVMFFSLASCGGKDKDKDTSETTGTSSFTETEKEETTGTTESTEKKDTEGELTTEKDNQAPTVTAGAETNGKDGSAKPGGKDTGKDTGKTENEKQTGSNTSETSKPSGDNTSGGQQSGGQQSGNETNGESSGGKTEETTSTTEPEEKDNEGEFVIPSEEIHLPILDIR